MHYILIDDPQSFFADDLENLRNLSLNPVHLTPDREGDLPPSALIPFCSYQGKSTLGRQSPELGNVAVCDQFEPTILEGQLCYSLDNAMLKGKVKSGKLNGLFLLLDRNPYSLNITEDNVKGPNDQSFKVFIHTLAQFTAHGPGSYAMSALKKMTGTTSFMQLPEEDKVCFVHNRENCQTQKYKREVQKNCNCIPWALQTDKVGNHFNN